MAADETARIIRVFLASPGDVAEERKEILDLLERRLPHDGWRHHEVLFKPIAWDHDLSGTPMLATMTPQDAVRRFSGEPKDCDIVIVVLWSRMGTHLDLAGYQRDDGSRYESGTEWEYENAFTATPRPDILVYRKIAPVLIDADAPDAEERTRQRRLVTQFLGRFRNPDGSFNGMSNAYADLATFKEKIESHLKQIVRHRLQAGSQSAQATTDPTPTTTTPAPTTPIPRPDACIGRDTDIDLILAALAPGKAVLVHGPGGIGKTTVTRHVALLPDIQARFPGRVWEAEQETARDVDSFDAQLLLGLGLVPRQGFAAATHRLGQAPALLVLDNLETAWEGARTGIEARLGQLAAIPGLALLASFRGHEPVRGAAWTRVPIEPLGRDDAWALFRRHAPHIADDDPDRAALMAALGGVPLAICLTAMRALHHDRLDRLWREWQRVGSAVAATQTDSPTRLNSVTASIEVSLASSRMTAPARRLFAMLGQCPAGLAEADRETLLAQDTLAAEDALLGLGLAWRRDGRIDLLPPVRDHARRAHPPGNEDAMAWCRHFLERARVEGDRIWGEGGAEARIALTPEVPNIDAALRAAPALDLLADAVRAVGGVGRLLRTSGAGSPAVLDALAQACRKAGDRPGEAECLYRYGNVALGRSDHETADRAQRAAAALYHDLDMPRDEAYCIQSLGDIALRRSDHDGARARYEDALPLFRRVGDVLGEANCIQRLGDIALDRSDHDGARARYEDALPLYRRVGAVLGEANCIKRLGNIALDRSDHDGARARYEDALPLYRRVGDVLGEANCIRSLGDIALARSDHDGARARYEDALPLCRRVGDVLGEANCVLGHGRVAEATGDTAAAKARYAQALAMYERVHRVDAIAIAHTDLADVTQDAERAGHIAAAVAAWRSMGLEDQARRVERRYGPNPGG